MAKKGITETPESPSNSGPGGPPTTAFEGRPNEDVKQPVGTEKAALSKDATNIAMLCHLLGIFTGFVGPLIIWLVKKDDDSFIDQQGKESLNFQITVLLAMIVSGLLCLTCIGFALLPLVWIANFVFCVIASIKVSNGQAYRYPLAIRLVK